ncbi:MAG: hypothetical protein FD167_3313 [bacterium]|nr:MAG: hypothetical protein FD167_3313 [bacterium]
MLNITKRLNRNELTSTSTSTSTNTNLNPNTNKTISQQKVDFILPTISEIKQRTRSSFNQVNRLWRKRNGYALIVLMFYIFIISLLAMLDPIFITTLNLKERWLNAAILRAEHLAWSTTSPVRYRLVDEVYTRVQTQLVDHIAKSKGSVPYQCQGALTQPETIDPVGGKLDNQFGLCQPETVLDGLNGLTGQTIDYLNTLYPEYKTPLTGENEVARQAIIRQNQNSYDYVLSTTYVNQRVIDDAKSKTFKTQTGFKRQESYRWLVRADIEAKSFNNVIKPIIVYYDVTLSNNYYPGNFGGGGNLCDRTNDVKTTACPVDLDELGFCHQTSYTDGNGTEWLAGTGPCPGGVSEGPCRVSDRCTDLGVAIVCPLAGGGQITTVKARSTRPQVGCASLNSGRSGKIIDKGGYNFILTVRIVSLGNTYN